VSGLQFSQAKDLDAVPVTSASTGASNALRFVRPVDCCLPQRPYCHKYVSIRIDM